MVVSHILLVFVVERQRATEGLVFRFSTFATGLRPLDQQTQLELSHGVKQLHGHEDAAIGKGGWHGAISFVAFKNSGSSFFGQKPFRLILPDLLDLYKYRETYIDRHCGVCRREGIAESMYYTWSKEFLDAGKRRLAGYTAQTRKAILYQRLPSIACSKPMI